MRARREAWIAVENLRAMFSEVIFFFTVTSLRCSPLFQVNKAEHQSNNKHTDRCVLDHAQLFVFFCCLVNNNAVNLARDHAVLGLNGSSGHGLQILR